MSAVGLLSAALKILGGAQVLLCFGLLAVWLLRALRAPGRMICVMMTVLLAGAFLPAGVQSAASLFNVPWIADISGMHAAPFSCSWVQIVSNSLAENGFPVQTAAAQTGARGIFESLPGKCSERCLRLWYTIGVCVADGDSGALGVQRGGRDAPSGPGASGGAIAAGGF